MFLPSTTGGECRICALASGSVSKQGYDQPWAENNHYLAMASVGALVPGWSLVFPKCHALNLLENLDEPSFWEFVGSAHAAVEKRYGRSVIFEHGCQYTGSPTGCGTSHAHLHIVPLSAGLVEASKKYDSSLTWLSCKAKDIPQLVRGDEYLFVADSYDGENTVGVVTLLSEGRSQYFRRVIADMLGRSDEYDYKTHPHTDVAARSAVLLRADINQLQQASAA
jgi:diadenosine tetraphosphate (Ap4A) HIT family hydrolase